MFDNAELPLVFDLDKKRKDYPPSSFSQRGITLADPDERITSVDETLNQAVQAMAKDIKLKPRLTEIKTAPVLDEREDVTFAHSVIAEEALRVHATDLANELGISENDAMVAAAAVLDSAGDRPGATVESMQTCMTLLKEPVPGMSGEDIPEKRKDEFSDTEYIRGALADLKLDMASTWLKLQNKYGTRGVEMGSRISDFINSKSPKDQPNYELMFAKLFLLKSKLKNTEQPISDDDFYLLLNRVLSKLSETK